MFNAKALKRIMEQRGITAEELTAQLNELGAYSCDVGHWGSGISSPSLHDLELLCELFQLPSVRFLVADGITLPAKLIADIMESLDANDSHQALGMLRGALTMLGFEVFALETTMPRVVDIDVPKPVDNAAILDGLHVGESTIIEKDGAEYRVTKTDPGEEATFRWERIDDSGTCQPCQDPAEAEGEAS